MFPGPRHPLPSLHLCVDSALLVSNDRHQVVVKVNILPHLSTLMYIHAVRHTMDKSTFNCTTCIWCVITSKVCRINVYPYTLEFGTQMGHSDILAQIFNGRDLFLCQQLWCLSKEKHVSDYVLSSLICLFPSVLPFCFFSRRKLHRWVFHPPWDCLIFIRAPYNHQLIVVNVLFKEWQLYWA